MINNCLLIIPNIRHDGYKNGIINSKWRSSNTAPLMLRHYEAEFHTVPPTLSHYVAEFHNTLQAMYFLSG